MPHESDAGSRNAPSARRHAGLAGEHRFTDYGQLLFLAVYLVVWVGDSFVLRLSVPASSIVPPFVRWPAGGVVTALGAALALTAHRRVFGDSGARPVLLTDGVYSLVRHPMYLGSWLFLLGLTVTTLSAAAAAVNALMLAFYLFVSRTEESLLLREIGARYREYQLRTPMFVPIRMRRKRPAGSDELP